jgi:hypothetical protein
MELYFMRYEDKTFTNEDIVVDDNEFYNCTFIRCKIIIGGKGMTLVGCVFESCPIVWDSYAATTIRILNALYHLGDIGQMEVEKVIHAIRYGSPQPRKDYGFDIE